jgi:uncharacterized membrane protein YeaQ/YmgE (transglycosylase-associated protein family)
MNLTALIIQLIAGALGGHAAGNVTKDVNLGPLGSTIADADGGGVGGQLLQAFWGRAVRPRGFWDGHWVDSIRLF